MQKKDIQNLIEASFVVNDIVSNIITICENIVNDSKYAYSLTELTYSVKKVNSLMAAVFSQISAWKNSKIPIFDKKHFELNILFEIGIHLNTMIDYCIKNHKMELDDKIAAQKAINIFVKANKDFAAAK